MASVISSPATGIMPKAIILPSFVRQISEVPAPTSTSPRFNNLKSSGTARLIAAIGSRVKLATFNPACSTAIYKLSTTSSGRNVAIKSTSIFLALWPSRLQISNPLRRYLTAQWPTQKNFALESSSFIFLCALSTADNSMEKIWSLLTLVSSSNSITPFVLTVFNTRPAAAIHTSLSLISSWASSSVLTSRIFSPTL